MLRRLLAVLAVIVSASSLTPRDAHAFASFKFFTSRAAFLAQFSGPTTQVDLNAIPEPGGSAMVGSIAGGMIGVSSYSRTTNVDVTPAEVVDPVAIGLPAFGTDKLLSTVITPVANPNAGAFQGGLRFALPAGVTGFAFTFGDDPAPGTSPNNESFVDASAGNRPQNAFYFPPQPGTGQRQFVGIVIDPTATGNPTTSIDSVAVNAALEPGSEFRRRLLVGDIEYTTSAVVATPEPATFALLGGGLSVLAAVAQRRRRR